MQSQSDDTGGHGGGEGGARLWAGAAAVGARGHLRRESRVSERSKTHQPSGHFDGWTAQDYPPLCFKALFSRETDGKSTFITLAEVPVSLRNVFTARRKNVRVKQSGAELYFYFRETIFQCFRSKSSVPLYFFFPLKYLFSITYCL